MKNNINIAELLKDCPKGMELDCTMYDGLEFDSIDESMSHRPVKCRIKCRNGGYNIHRFSKYGLHDDTPHSKCVIFPKGKTTWDGFVPPCKFKDGDILITAHGNPFILKEIDNNKIVETYCGIRQNGEFVIGSSHWTSNYNLQFATEEEKQKLFDAIKANGYKWNAETKTLEKLFELKFKVGDIAATGNGIWIGIIKKPVNYAYKTYVTINGESLMYDTPIFCFERFATEEEKKKLFDAIKENGYKWNTETKTLEKLIEPKFKDGDVISDSLGTCIFKGEGRIKGTVDYYCGIHTDYFIVKDNKSNPNGHYGNIVDYRFATEEEKKKLFDAIKENGYKWNTETKTLEKLIRPKFKVGDRIKNKNSGIRDKIIKIFEDCYLVESYLDEQACSYEQATIGFDIQDNWELVPNKFNISTLKPFDKVLVRCNSLEKWHIQFFEKYNTELGAKYPFICLCNSKYCQCIPYKGNEHLLDTTNECDDYKNW